MLVKFWQSRKGNYATMAALLAVPFMVGVGTAVDYTNMLRTRSELQAALDAGSMQIAFKATSGLSDPELEELGEKAMLANLDDDIKSHDVPELEYLGMTTEADGSKVLNTRTRYTYHLAFLNSFFIGRDTTGITVNAAIRSRAADPACIYALSQTNPRTINVTGSTTIDLDGCIIASNSKDDESIYVSGNAKIKVGCAQAAGQISATDGLVTDCEQNRENAWILDDPFVGIPEPARPMALQANPKKKDTAMVPGRYKDLVLDGTKTLAPGIYYVEGGLDIRGTISGDGVMIFIADGSVVVNASASLDLSASSNPSDVYAGILFMAARSNTSPMTFNGTGAMQLDGFIYSAAGAVTYSGNNGATHTCTRIVSYTVTLTGNSDFKRDCDTELGGREARVAGPLYFSR